MRLMYIRFRSFLRRCRGQFVDPEARAKRHSLSLSHYSQGLLFPVVFQHVELLKDGTSPPLVHAGPARAPTANVPPTPGAALVAGALSTGCVILPPNLSFSFLPACLLSRLLFLENHNQRESNRNPLLHTNRHVPVPFFFRVFDMVFDNKTRRTSQRVAYVVEQVPILELPRQILTKRNI